MSQVYAYTDGACANNQVASKRVGGWAAVLLWVNDAGQHDDRPAAYQEKAGKLEGATNNQAELEAVRQVLLALKRDGVRVTVFTDSDYVIGVLSRHWKAARNQALIAEIKGLMSKHTVTFEKVKAHADETRNQRADTLAKATTQASV